MQPPLVPDPAVAATHHRPGGTTVAATACVTGGVVDRLVGSMGVST